MQLTAIFSRTILKEPGADIVSSHRVADHDDCSRWRHRPVADIEPQ
jgi:hypothetical protein